MTPQAGGAAMGGVGSLMSGLGQYESGQEQKGAYDYNAAITLDNMRNQVEANKQKFTSLVGKQATGYAASGVDIASGSPLMIMAATAAQGARQGEQIKEAGTEEAALQTYYGKIAAWSGTMGGISSFLSGMNKTMTSYGMATGAFDPKGAN